MAAPEGYAVFGDREYDGFGEDELEVDWGVSVVEEAGKRIVGFTTRLNAMFWVNS